ncbi:hypothetical protein Dimus_034880 [Dionaea muscipula]
MESLVILLLIFPYMAILLFGCCYLVTVLAQRWVIQHAVPPQYFSFNIGFQAANINQYLPAPIPDRDPPPPPDQLLALFALLLPFLVSLIQLKYQQISNSSPFHDNPLTMSIAVVSVLPYSLGSRCNIHADRLETHAGTSNSPHHHHLPHHPIHRSHFLLFDEKYRAAFLGELPAAAGPIKEKAADTAIIRTEPSNQKQESEQRQSGFPTEAEAKQSKVAAIHTIRRAAARRRRRTGSKAAATNWEQSSSYSHHTARARRSKAAAITTTGKPSNLGGIIVNLECFTSEPVNRSR